MTTTNLNACPCCGGTIKQSNKKCVARHVDCCQPYHHGTPAPTAVALMRSRYSAFAFGMHDYLQATWHPRTRPAPHSDLQLDWIGLTIVRHEMIGNTHAKVSFIARYRANDRVHRLTETSCFVREIGDDGLLRWFYVGGDVS